MSGRLRVLSILAGLLIASHPQALTCRDPAGFEKWLDDVRQEAVAQGISRAAVDAGLSGVTFDPGILRRDRGQGVFKQSFEQFAGRMISSWAPSDRRVAVEEARGRLDADRTAIRRSRTRVGGNLGLETDYGAVRGNLPRSVRSPRWRSIAVVVRILPGPSLRCAADRPAWRSHTGRDARRLGRRDGPNAIHALVLCEICCRFRRGRPRRPFAQPHRRAGLHGQLSQS